MKLTYVEPDVPEETEETDEPEEKGGIPGIPLESLALGIAVSRGAVVAA